MECAIQGCTNDASLYIRYQSENLTSEGNVCKAHGEDWWLQARPLVNAGLANWTNLPVETK